MKRKHLVSVVVVIFLSWNIIMYHVLVSKNPGKTVPLEERLKFLESDIKKQLNENSQILQQLRILKRESEYRQNMTKKLVPHKTKKITKSPPQTKTDDSILPILMIACDRTTVSRSLDQLLKYRPSGDKFPIIVSQDCNHQPTADIIQGYVKNRGIKHIKQPDLSVINLPWPKKKFLGYYKIARHYKWALNQIFHVFNYTSVIIVEDDLDISPDFYEYFAATFPILKSDPTVWCVSAWNDNGKTAFVADEPELLYRTDFFPGLGWMMEKKTWDELGPKWPETFWDDWMRHEDQRKNRVCIRPEICRTSTFGKKGVSKGLFYEKHLKFIKLNSKFVPFTQKDLSYLKKDLYDPMYTKKVYDTPELSVAEVITGSKKHMPALRVQYKTKESFKAAAKKLGIMDDFKAGVPRTAYNGIVSLMYNGQRIYLSPPKDWSGYDPKWT